MKSRPVVVSVKEQKLNQNGCAINRSAILLFVGLALGLATPPRVHAATRTVCANDCQYATIAAAIAASNAGDTIKISDAVHTEWNITVDRNLTIAGRGAAKTIVDAAQNIPVFTVHSGVTATLRNLTIRDAGGFGSCPSIFCGGAVVNQGALTISGSMLSGNFPDVVGGTVFNEGTLTVANSTLSNNDVFGGSGGIYNDGGTVTIRNSTLSSNSSQGGGGALLNDSGTVTISNSTLSRNGGSFGGAGGVFNYDGTLAITNSTLSDNGGSGSGAIESFDSTVTISNSTLSGNFTIGHGGAIANYGGTVAVSFSTLADNGVDPSIGGNGGGLWIQGGTATVKNSIVGDNSGGDCAGSVTALGANLDTDGSCGTSNFTQVTSAQLNLGPLALNAPGTTATQALLPGSVAIGAVTDCTDVAENSVTADQRGTLRPDPAEVVCDAGAYELQDFAGQANCVGKSVSALVQRYGNLPAAASAYGFSSVKALNAAILRSCRS